MNFCSKNVKNLNELKIKTINRELKVFSNDGRGIPVNGDVIVYGPWIVKNNNFILDKSSKCFKVRCKIENNFITKIYNQSYEFNERS